jgi:signal transduction histidine kinase
MLAAARRAARAEHAALLVRVGVDLIAVATDPPVMLGPRAARISPAQGPAGRVALHRTSVHVPDLAEEPGLHPEPILWGARSYLAFPLLAGERLLGVLQLSSSRRRAFSGGRRRRAEEATRRLADFLAGEGAGTSDIPDAAEGRDPIAVVAHELRAPLTSLRGLSETLARGVAGDDPALVRDIAGRILRATARLERRVSDLSDLARAGPQGLEVRPVAVDAALLLRDVAGEDRGTHSLVLEVEDETPEVQADPDRLEQVVENLLANARRYSPQGSEVVLSARRAGDRVEIAVRDRGPGIRPEDRERIFDPFVRLGPGKGLGIGLTIARTLVESMGGRLEVDAAPGGGSTFTVTLPAATT